MHGTKKLIIIVKVQTIRMQRFKGSNAIVFPLGGVKSLSFINYRIPSNKRRVSDKCRASKYSVYQNSYYILLEAKPKCIWTSYANNKAIKILLIFRFFLYIWFIDSENLSFILILKEKMTRFWHLVLFIFQTLK